MSIANRVREVLPVRQNFEVLRPRYTFDVPIAVTSDFHIPYIDEVMVERLYTAAQRHGIRDLFIVGDLWNMDEFSRFEPGLNRPTAAFMHELDAGHGLLEILYEVFDNIYYSQGNHDLRLVKKIGMAFGVFELMRMLWPEGGLYRDGVGRWKQGKREKTLVVNQLPSVNVAVAGHQWYFTHPKNYSRNPLSVARQMAAKHHCNVGIGHTHCYAAGYDSSGKYHCLDLGGLFRREYLAYIFETDTTNPTMTNGFFVLEDGGEVVGYSGRIGQ